MRGPRKSNAVWGPMMLGWYAERDGGARSHARIGNSWRSRSACGAEILRDRATSGDAPCRKCLRALDALGISSQIRTRTFEVRRVAE